MTLQTILLALEQTPFRDELAGLLRQRGYAVREVADAAGALLAMRQEPPALVLASDLLPGGGGTALLTLARKAELAIPLVVVSRSDSAAVAVGALRAGAEDFVVLPCAAGELAERLQTVLSRSNPLAQAAQNGLVLGDLAMLPVLELARLGADSSVPVLLQGESGTGKEVLARYIHRLSGRPGPFLAVNCAALPESLLESELFGHEKGAFTGAAQRRIGHFEAAERGTLLLDEISEMELPLQAKLLRVLQEFEVCRIGSNRPVALDVKLIATTNRDLSVMVQQGQFRRDLYYRLRVFPLEIPALRQRPGDIPVLARFFLRRFAEQHERPVPELRREAEQLLLEHSWPGNVRELEHTLSRAALLAGRGPVGPEHLLLERPGVEVESPRSAPAPPPVVLAAAVGTVAPAVRPSLTELVNGLTLAEVEQRLILETLDLLGGNRTKTSERLGISIRTLRNKLRAYREAGLAVPASAGEADAGPEPPAAGMLGPPARAIRFEVPVRDGVGRALTVHG